MNHAAGIQPIAAPQRPPHRGPALGWGISLLVHALAVAWLWRAWPSAPVDNDPGPRKQIEVRLIPLAQEAPPRPSAAAPDSQAASRSAVEPAPAAKARRATPNRVRPKDTQTPPSATSGITVPAPEAPPSPAAPAAEDTPAVDLAAARAAARRIAHENAKGLVALPERKPVTDPNENHHVIDPIERARRVDCQTARAQSTNLLGNIVMLAVDLTKNAIDDSGCKWR